MQEAIYLAKTEECVLKVENVNVNLDIQDLCVLLVCNRFQLIEKLILNKLINSEMGNRLKRFK